jgi:hypothetical protein
LFSRCTFCWFSDVCWFVGWFLRVLAFSRVAALGGLRVLVSRCCFSCWSVRGLPAEAPGLGFAGLRGKGFVEPVQRAFFVEPAQRALLSWFNGILSVEKASGLLRAVVCASCVSL